MITAKKLLFRTLKLLFVAYVLIGILLYFFQEKMIFLPEKIENNFKYSFSQKFEEVNIETKDKKILNALLFKSDSSKGLVFYLHGNAGSIRSWGDVAASTNNPRLLILQAPYYSLVDMMRHTYPIIPTFLLKYKFENNKYIKDCKMPIVIFHGDKR